MKYYKKIIGLGTSVTTIASDHATKITSAWDHRLTISKGTATVGTVTVKVKMRGANGLTVLKDPSVAISKDLSALTEPYTYIFPADMEAWEITATGVTGLFEVVVSGRD
jgi:hypothetical protein